VARVSANILSTCVRGANRFTGQLLAPYVESVFSLLQTIFQDPNRSEALLRTSMGVIGDLSETFPNGEYSASFSQQWVTNMAREVRANKEYSQRTQDTARWAREQIKRQSGKSSCQANTSNHH
jgi:importin subunit beta-1